MDQPHLAWHLSGGTTELLLVEPFEKNVRCTRIGGTSDISAGQLIDRTGQLLSLPFPSGKHIDALSQECDTRDFFKVRCSDFTFSLSGVQNKIQQFAQNHDPSQVARYCLGSVIYAVYSASVEAMKRYFPAVLLPTPCFAAP